MYGTRITSPWRTGPNKRESPYRLARLRTDIGRIQAYVKAGALLSDFVEPKLSRKSVVLYRMQYAKITALARAAAAAIEATTTVSGSRPLLFVELTLDRSKRSRQNCTSQLP